jgi:hypothetical protein
MTNKSALRIWGMIRVFILRIWKHKLIFSKKYRQNRSSGGIITQK